MDSESVVSILRGREGWDNHYDEISKFKEHLHLREGSVAEESFGFGWVLWSSDHITLLQHRIITLFRHIASDSVFRFHYLVQFWTVEEGQNRTFLSTTRQPFSVGNLTEGLSWYRKLCVEHVYVVAVEDEDEQPPVGGVGRAYRNGYSESTPDLRLYSSDEFPMRDEAARSGLRGYLALPLFEFNSSECCGVLELVSGFTVGGYELSSLDQGLQNAGLRSTHINFVRISESRDSMPNKYKQQPESEIGEVLKLAMATVPQLHFAQVWVPCKQCGNSICMERACFMNVDATTFNSCTNVDEDMFVYLQACEFHNLQLDPNHYFRQNLCDLGISKNPLAHYAKKARLSHWFAISLQHDGPYVIELFLQPNCRDDDALSLRSISRIIEMKLENLELISREHLPEELVQSRQLVAMFNDMESFSESDFTNYIDTLNSYSCCLRPSSEDGVQGWVFCMASTENDDESVLVRERIENFMKNLIAAEAGGEYWIVQFWAPKLMVGGRCSLQALDQPYAVGCLDKGLASLRKKCIGLGYFVDEEAQEEELGPPGRVFRIGSHETTPDLSLYTTKEFPIKTYAVNCCLQQYFALPLFNDEHRHKCIGVLELIGVPISSLKLIRCVLEEAKLCSTHIDFSPIFPENDDLANEAESYSTHIDFSRFFSENDNLANKQMSSGRDRALSEVREAFLQLENIPQLHMAKEAKLCSTHIDFSPIFPENDNLANKQMMSGSDQALAEMREAFLQMANIPQLHMAKVWIPNSETCSSAGGNNARCMELALSTQVIMLKNQVHWIHVKPGKGMIGMVLDSESKSCFCRNLYEFSIVDQPLAHYQRKERLDDCFAICLRSSHTGEDFPYVLEFFLYQSHDYLVSFLNFLVPIMKQQLKSFEYASGKQLVDEMVVEVIEVSRGNNTSLTFDEMGVKFKSVDYSHGQEAPMQCVSDITQTEQSSKSSVVRSKKRTKAKGKTGSHLKFEVLKPHFGKKLKYVAEELDVGRSTIKRVCRDNGIKRWPSNKKNPSVLERESGRECDEEEVMMKVRYKEDTIKFKLRLSLGVTKLLEEVASGLNLKMSTFKLKYLDEDNEEILLARDVDFQHCPRITTASGVACIKLFVQLISE